MQRTKTKTRVHLIKVMPFVIFYTWSCHILFFFHHNAITTKPINMKFIGDTDRHHSEEVQSTRTTTLVYKIEEFCPL